MLKRWLLTCAILVALVAVAVPAQAQRFEKFIPPPSGVFEFVGFSSGTVDGTVGVLAMHATCQADFGPDVRMCTSEEYWRSPSAADPGPTPAWVHPSPGPGASGRDFSGATVSDVDLRSCGGWTGINGTGLAIGQNGSTLAVFCNEARPVTCCARLK